MKKLLTVALFVVGAAFALGGYAAQSSGDIAQKVTRAEAKAMGLSKTGYYLVYNTEDMSQLDVQINEKLKQSSVAYYSVVYFLPRKNKDHYQAMIIEYSNKADY